MRRWPGRAGCAALTGFRLPRIDLPELMDQPWLPPWLRDGLTDGLRGAERALPFFRPIVPLIGGLTGPAAGRVVDLGSGAGGPMPVLWPALREAGVAELVLSDLFPHAGRWCAGRMAPCATGRTP